MEQLKRKLNLGRNYGQIARKKEIGKIVQAAICVPWGSGCHAAEAWSRSIGSEFVDIARQIYFNISAFRSGIKSMSGKVESKILRVDVRIVKSRY
jgi:hypothetical protein